MSYNPTLPKAGSALFEKSKFWWEEEKQIESEVRQGGAHLTSVPTGSISCPLAPLLSLRLGGGKSGTETTFWLLSLSLRLYAGTQDLVGPDNAGQMVHLQPQGKHICAELQTYSCRNCLEFALRCSHSSSQSIWNLCSETWHTGNLPCAFWRSSHPRCGGSVLLNNSGEQEMSFRLFYPLLLRGNPTVLSLSYRLEEIRNPSLLLVIQCVSQNLQLPTHQNYSRGYG